MLSLAFADNTFDSDNIGSVQDIYRRYEDVGSEELGRKVLFFDRGRPWSRPNLKYKSGATAVRRLGT